MDRGTSIWVGSCLAAAAFFAAASAHGAAPAISAGTSHSVALHADGTVSAWGSDRSGQLGVGRASQYASPVEVPAIADVRAVAAGSAHVVAVKKDGTVMTWGLNDSGQLGDGTFQPHSSPAAVPGLEKIVAVAAGDLFSLALAEDGTVWSWGDNFTEQLGHLPKAPQNRPSPIPGLSGIVAISAGQWHALALARDGSVWVWGGNDRGQLGNLTIGAGPWKVTGISDAKAIAAGMRSSQILRGDGTVWGAGGGLCTGNNNDAHSFIPTLLSGVTALASGGGVTLAIQGNGTVSACGSNSSGQLGIGPQVFSSASPQMIGGLGGIVAVCAGKSHSMALRSDGKVFTWGSNQNGQLGNPSTLGGIEPYPAPIAIDDAGALACGADSNTEPGTGFSLVLKKDGSLWMFGNDLDGIAGDGAVQRTSPGRAAGLDQVVAISAAGSTTLAVRSDGTVWSWGQRQLHLPDNVSTDSRPAQVPGISGAIAVSVGGERSLALRGDGTVYSWGGPLLGGLILTNDLGLVPGLTGIVAIAAGAEHLVALRSDGTVLAWGRNQYGQVGDGATTDRAAPVVVTGLTDVVAISAGAEYTLALKRDGTVWGWGINGLNQVSTDASPSHPTPAAIANLSGVKAISAGPTTPLALKSDGTIWTWGYQTGGGVVRAAGSLVADAISQGGNHALAMKRDGTVWAWGNNFDGELGNGTLVSGEAPTVVIAEDGKGSIEGDDWFLDLDPSVPSVVPAEFIPAFLVLTTGDPGSAVARVQYRSKDVGKTGSVYVFALTPAASSKRATKDGACQLAQLGSNGQLVPVAPSDLQAAVTGILTAQGQLVTILNNASAGQYPNSTFFVGYGTTATDMFDNGTARGVVTLGDGSTCSLPSGFASVAYPGPLSGLWWNPGESGWGIDFTQRRDVIFAAWYTYDTAGKSKWYVASSCPMPASGTTSGTCTGPLYEVKGPVFFGVAFDPNAVNVTAAGSLNVSFASADNASMTYTLGGQTRTVSIERQVFASGKAPGVDYTDLWWNPHESGWGIAVSQQSNVMFLTWFVYDEGGIPTWYVASNCTVSGQGCSGALYRTTGPAFGPAFDATSVQVSTVGTVALSFTDPNNGTLTYTVNGASGTKAITRQLF